jgi:hypothetical protein
MQYSVLIDQKRALEWGLDISECAVLELVARAASWATPGTSGGKVFYQLTNAKMRAELPLFVKSERTTWRILERLEEKGLVERMPGTANCRLTDLGRQWNTDALPLAKMATPPCQNGNPPVAKMATPSIRVPGIIVPNQNTTPQPPQAGETGGFAEFYAKYPYKKAPGTARRAYNAAIKKATHEQIMDGLGRYVTDMDALRKKQAKAGEDPRQYAYPATWLNGERWADQPEPSAPTSAAGEKTARAVRESAEIDENERKLREAKRESEDIMEFFKSYPEEKKDEMLRQVDAFLESKGIATPHSKGMDLDPLASRVYQMARRSRIVYLVRPNWQLLAKLHTF